MAAIDYAIVFHRMGCRGAANATTYEQAVRTWDKGNPRPIPTEAECAAEWSGYEAEQQAIRDKEAKRRQDFQRFRQKRARGESLTTAELQHIADAYLEDHARRNGR